MSRLPKVPRQVTHLLFFASLSTALLVGCEDSGPNAPGSGPLAILVVSPNPNAMATSSDQLFTATGQDANGNAVSLPEAPTWSVAGGGGSIDATTGLFTAGTAPGTFANTIQATSGGVSGYATVSVISGALASISITPDPVSVAAGVPVQFTATGRDAGGNIIALTPSWSLTDSDAGTIDAVTGEYTTGIGGSYPDVVIASSGGIAGNASITVVGSGGPLTTILVSPNPSVLAAGDDRQFVAEGQDASGVRIAITPAPTWSVVNGGGTIGASTGLFTAGGTTGSFSNTVSATSGLISGSASVSITGSAPIGPSLGSAAPFAVLGSTAISCIGVSDVAGNVGVAPAGSVSGFPAPCTISAPGLPIPQVNNAIALTAQADVTPAYNALAAMPCGTSLTDQDLGGMTLAPGVYCFTSGAQLTGTLTLAGPASGLWVFQVASALTTGTSAQVVMSGGGEAKNVYWQVGSSATIGQTTIFRGNIIAAVSVTLVQGASLTGRALSKAGITMDTNTLTLP